MRTDVLSRVGSVVALTRAAAIAVNYCFVVGLARLMSQADYGIVGTVISATILFSMIGMVGQHLILLRLVPPLIEMGGSTTPLIVRSFRLAALGNFVIYVALVLLVLVLSQIGRLSQGALIAFGLLTVPLTGWIVMQAHLARAFRSILLAIVPKDILWRLLSLLTLSGLYVFADMRPMPLWIVLVVLVGVLSSLILVQGLILRSRVGFAPLSAIETQPLAPTTRADWKRLNRPLWISSVSGLVFTNLDVIIAGVFMGPEIAAIYFSANRIALVPRMFTESLVIVIGPILSSLHATGRKKEAAILIHGAVLRAFVPATLTVIGLAFFGHIVLSFFGEEYASGALALRVLLLTAVVLAFLGPADLVLTMCGEERVAMRISIISVFVGMILLMIGGFFGTVESLALAVLTAALFQRVLGWFMVRRRLQLSIDVFSALLDMLQRRKRQGDR